MKNILFAIYLVFACLATLPTLAAPSPYGPKLDARLNKLEVQYVAKFQYDFSYYGGDTGTYSLGVYLPANAIITRSFLYVDTQLVDDGSGTLAFHCEDANNIKTATDMTGSSAGAFIEGESTGASSAFKGSIAARCEITATIATAAITAGKITGWVKYVVHD
jgi:hypothetical protein